MRPLFFLWVFFSKVKPLPRYIFLDNKVITVRYVYEESEMAPFERYTDKVKNTCPDNCEAIR